MLIPRPIEFRAMPWVSAFVAGFLATVIFHQGMLQAFNLFGIAEVDPYNFEPVPPLGVPAVISLAFWGGVWGLPLWWLVRRWRGTLYWFGGIVGGALAPTTVALLVVFPLKGLEVTGATVVGGLVVNAAWGLGVVLVLYPIRTRLDAAQAQGERGDGR